MAATDGSPVASLAWVPKAGPGLALTPKRFRFVQRYMRYTAQPLPSWFDSIPSNAGKINSAVNAPSGIAEKLTPVANPAFGRADQMS